MKSLKSKNEINQAAFAPNMYDPLGMYGCFPALMTFETYEPLETPTQDADDLQEKSTKKITDCSVILFCCLLISCKP